MLALIGSYANQLSMADVQIMVIAGVVGLIVKACHFNSAAMVLGLVLGSMCEANFSRAYTMCRGSFATMFFRPIAGPIMIFCIIMLVTPILMPAIRKRKAAKKAA